MQLLVPVVIYLYSLLHYHLQYFHIYSIYSQVNAACDWEAAAKNEKGALSLECVRLLNEASAQIANVNMYNIYGDWYEYIFVPSTVYTTAWIYFSVFIYC